MQDDAWTGYVSRSPNDELVWRSTDGFTNKPLNEMSEGQLLNVALLLNRQIQGIHSLKREMDDPDLYHMFCTLTVRKSASLALVVNKLYESVESDI